MQKKPGAECHMSNFVVCGKSNRTIALTTIQFALYFKALLQFDIIGQAHSFENRDWGMYTSCRYLMVYLVHYFKVPQ